eukprot:Sspe_Gene.35194::Locus_17066_Transcript_1_3_Confidence_0.500_Length_1506::g.35194::m.35194
MKGESASGTPRASSMKLPCLLPMQHGVDVRSDDGEVPLSTGSRPLEIPLCQPKLDTCLLDLQGTSDDLGYTEIFFEVVDRLGVLPHVVVQLPQLLTRFRHGVKVLLVLRNLQCTLQGGSCLVVLLQLFLNDCALSGCPAFLAGTVHLFRDQKEPLVVIKGPLQVPQQDGDVAYFIVSIRLGVLVAVAGSGVHCLFVVLLGLLISPLCLQLVSIGYVHPNKVGVGIHFPLSVPRSLRKSQKCLVALDRLREVPQTFASQSELFVSHPLKFLVGALLCALQPQVVEVDSCVLVVAALEIRGDLNVLVVDLLESALPSVLLSLTQGVGEPGEVVVGDGEHLFSKLVNAYGLTVGEPVQLDEGVDAPPHQHICTQSMLQRSTCQP